MTMLEKLNFNDSFM